MMSIAPMSGTGQGEYYLNLAREDYYLEGGEPPGEWLGNGAAALDLSGTVDKEQFRNLLQGYSPDGQEELVQNAGKENRQVGWDMTFSAPKSVSTAWSQSEGDTRQEFQEAQREAVNAAVKYLQENAAFTRRGRAGIEREPAGLTVATFEHGTSRAQDPQLHTHALVLNVGTREDGSTGSIESKPLYQHKMAAGAVYRAELAAQLEERLGLEAERKSSWFELKGVNRELVEEFSKRRKEIEEALDAKGFSSAKAASFAALDTREVKEHIARDTLFDKWKTTGQELGWSTKQLEELTARGHRQRNLESERKGAIENAVNRITEHNNSFSYRDLVRFSAEEAQGRGVGAKAITEGVKDHLRDSPEIVSLGTVNGEARYTTREIVETEKVMLAGVKRLNEVGQGREVKRETLKWVCLERPSLTVEQWRAVEHITQEPGGIKAVSGMAGTGKSYMLEAARTAWEREGFTVVGAALSGKAAQGLEEGAGIKSETLHRRFSQLEDGSLSLNKNSVFVVDEAGMVGTKQMARLVSEVEQRGAKLVLVGDARQLQPVDAGGPFKVISEQVGAATLTEIKRQREEWARVAVHKIAGGEAAGMLKDYAERGLLFAGENRAEALNQAIQDWKKGGAENPKEHLLLAGTNEDVRELNRLAQQERYSIGGLGDESIRVKGETFLQGDRVLFTRNSRLYGVKNGELGTIEKLNGEERTLTTRLDSGKKITIDLAHYEHVKLGYAVTTHKSQGTTVENSYVVLGGSMQDRELSYVQASRAREKTRLYANKLEGGYELKELSKEMSQSRQKGLVMEQLEQRQSKQEQAQQHKKVIQLSMS